MKNNLSKRILCMLLILALVLGCVPVAARAEEPLMTAEMSAPSELETVPETTVETVPETTVPETTVETAPETTAELLLEDLQPDAAPGEDGETEIVESEIHINPLYADILDPDDFIDWVPSNSAVSPDAGETVYQTEAQAIEAIRGCLKARCESFTISCELIGMPDVGGMVEEAMAHTGNPTEGDYIAWQYQMWKTDKFTIYISNGVYSFSIPFTACYYDDAQQEAEMDVAVPQLLDTLNLDGKSDYEKIKGVYDYICSNVNYDYTNLNDDAYKLKLTAYAALVNKTAVCQGYAVLLYRLMLELGIDCRVITGIGKTNNGNGPHAWNIIQLDNGTYYNADSTWDAGRTNYGYFLKGSGFDTDHERGDAYLTDEFCADYPTAIADYDPSTAVPQGNCGENLLWKVQDGALIIYAAGTGTPGAMTNYSDVSPAPWSELADQITSIDVQAGTTIGANAFAGLSNADCVWLPFTLEDVAPGAFVGCTALTDFFIEDGGTIGSYFAEGPVLLKYTASMGIQVVTVAPSVEGHFDVPNYGVLLPDALLGCEKISSIRFRNYFRYLPEGALNGCAEELMLCFEGYEPPYIEKEAFAGHIVTIASCPLTQGWKEIARDGDYGGTAIWPEELFQNEDVESENACGENLAWRVEDGALIIYGTGTGTPGAMTNYSDASPAPWAEFADQITDIRMRAGTAIGTNAFVGLSEVRHVALPQSLTDITPGAFADCINLVDFNFYSAVQYFTDGPVILKTTASDGIQVVTVAPSVTGSFEVPNFGMILPGALLGCENISSIYFRDNFKYLPDGTLDGCAEDLSLTFAGAVPPQIEGNAFAGHNVTISCPVNWVWSQAAKGGNYGGTAIWPEGLADLNVTMSLMNGDEVLGDTLDLDMSDAALLTLTAQFQPASAQETVTWSSSNTKVAAVDKKTGEVTLLKPGTAKITAAAADGSGVTASVTLNIVYVTAAKTLTARLNEDLPVIGLQPGQTRTLTVYGGENAIPAEKLSFVSSNSEIASVDENGRITAGTKPGTATITVRPKDDPLNRKVTVKVTVIAMQAQSLTLAVDNEQKTELELPMSAESCDYALTASAADYQGNSFAPKVTWSSTDTSVAKVTTAKDGTVTLTIPKNANGECVITAVANDLNKIQSQLKISVRDYSPRLGNSKLTLNSYSTEGAVLDLRESYGNTIEKVELVGAPKEFTLIDNTLYAKQAPNRTYNLQLKVTCEKGIYSKFLQVKVAKTLPSVSVKQTEKFNLFYTDSTANLRIAASGQIIDNVELVGTDDFTVDFDKESGTASIAYADAFLESPVTKPTTRVTLEIWLEGYNTPVTKAITISTMTVAPKLTLSPASSTINTALSEDHAVTIQVQDNTNGGTLILDDTNTEVSANFADTSFVGGSLNLTLHEGSKGGTAVISVQDSSWVKPITLKHKVTVSTKLPTLVLSKKALTLNSIFTEQTDEMSVSPSQGNLALDDLTLTCTAKESEKLNVYYAGGSIHAEIINKDNAPKQGTYSYTCTWTAPDGRTVRTTLKVVVASTVPKVKLSASTVKLNKSLAGKESIQVRPIITGGAGYTLEGFEGADGWLNFEDGVLQVKLTEKPDNGKYTFKVKPVFKHDATKQEVTLPTVLTLTVQVYDAVPKVTLSAKNKLVTLNPNSAIVYTPKLTNYAGAVTDVKLDEAYSQDFKADMENGTVKLTLKDGVKYATNITYKVRFNLTVCGETIQSPVMNVKVTQSSVKYTLSPSALTLYQSQSAPLTVKLTPSVGEISQVTVNTKSSKELIAALGQDGFTFEGGKTANLSMAFENKSILKAGKSYALYLDVTPKNNALNAKPAQVKLSVKVMK